jgi:branched-chain amino acid transport system permease protein
MAVNYIVKSAIENIQAIGGARGFMGMARVVNGMQSVVNLPWMMIWTWIFVFLTGFIERGTLRIRIERLSLFFRLSA